ncbi:bifunctional hydroxymethylpyrimidine kinase/phosphomethylpyrimidine kinase [uncultured Corynebacterium sp.]|uniref:bifunctional hydroxymethylpyrimidine kinase/phosphomethylpyrimidine kinase n=1 Tax=uncultured Corynebacterium sp. TaxID=159447 RepID=UPI0034575639
METIARAPIPRVLSIAGSDCSGGAGIQADLKSIAAAGGYGMTAVTALTAQNTHGVSDIHTPPVHFLQAQLDSVRSDITIDAIKVGMLGSAEVCGVVADFLHELTGTPIVLDPVMIATSGDRLLDAAAEASVRELCPLATVITPNLPELAVLTRTPVATSLDDAIATAASWAQSTNTAVVVKGGHLAGLAADNAWVSPDGTVHRVRSARIDTPNTHGTGCSLSSALATCLGAGMDGPAALEWSTRWLHEAIAHSDALAVGSGEGHHGPVDHGYRHRRLAAAASTAPRTPRPAASASVVRAPDCALAPAGPHTQRLWNAALPEWEDVLGTDFIHDLGVGTLRADDFSFYLQQDAHYLDHYSKALARLAALAPQGDHAAQLHWARGAADCIEVEAALHRDWLGGHPFVAASPVTQAYTDFLVATTHTRDYVIGAAAVLPCYWLYAEVGLRLAAHNHPEHPYHAWLSMYSGEEFLASTRKAIALVEQALELADATVRDEALDAYVTASRYEVDFFDQAARRW